MKRNKERKKERKSSYLTQNLYRTSLSVPVKKNLEGNSWKTYKTFTVTYKQEDWQDLSWIIQIIISHNFQIQSIMLSGLGDTDKKDKELNCQ